ncbi:Hint domain-containing protein [Antarctobacter heliothermus]|uniref:Hint domain-containing protein n=1 Tax=Antarctobacter heliothermus TaxID=74033 RepID=A0A239IJ06_9RHOB|nr:Hint domain-containing protein [Antarctobacter heliothermus]SNS93607.1 Hint domain-containing protein [Antarctobacter heliothermus]
MERSGTFPGDGAVPVDVMDEAGLAPGRVQVSPPEIAGGLPCCARIKTLQGERRAGDLRPGDRVLTRDNGYQPMRWSGRTPSGSPAVAAIRMRKGVLGHGVPERVMLVAPGQRFVIGGPRLRHLLGLAEATVTAAQLTRLKGVAALYHTPGVHVQMLFDRHEVLLAEGVWTESLRLTPAVLARLPRATQDALIAAGPALAEDGSAPPARPPVPPDLVPILLRSGDRPDLARSVLTAQVTRDRT